MSKRPTSNKDMTTKELIATLAAETGISKAQVADLLAATTELTTQALLDNKVVHVQNFGDLEVRKKNERLSIHPRTGVRTLTPPKLQLSFKQHAALKEELKNV